MITTCFVWRLERRPAGAARASRWRPGSLDALRMGRAGLPGVRPGRRGVYGLMGSRVERRRRNGSGSAPAYREQPAAESGGGTHQNRAWVGLPAGLMGCTNYIFTKDSGNVLNSAANSVYN
jgi:hypothetical protein